MPIVLIDGQELDIPAGTRINAIEAARRAGIEIPHYCWHPGLSVVGSCRMCLVETGQRDAATGKITMQPKLVPGCSTLVSDGMVVVTRSQQVKRAERWSRRGCCCGIPSTAPSATRPANASCRITTSSTGRTPGGPTCTPSPAAAATWATWTLFVDRCILCSRCVRFTAEISGTNELMVTGRGAQEEIDVAPGRPLRNNLSGNVVDLCPVGALADKDFLYQQRVWFLRRHKGVCTGCAVGCSIWIEENQDHIYRLKPRENRAAE